jgi:hypothetical protein
MVSGFLGVVAGAWYSTATPFGLIPLIGGAAGLLAGALVGWFWAWRVRRGLGRYIAHREQTTGAITRPAVRWGVWGGLAASLAVHGVLIATVHLLPLVHMPMAHNTEAIWPIVAILGQIVGLLGGAVTGVILGGVVCAWIRPIRIHRLRKGTP